MALEKERLPFVVTKYFHLILKIVCHGTVKVHVSDPYRVEGSLHLDLISSLND